MNRKKKSDLNCDEGLATTPSAVPAAVEALQEEQSFDGSLRPRDLDDYIGQEGVKQNLRIAIDAAKQRGDVLDHLLFYGPPGLGKTSLAHIIAREMGVAIRATTGPVIERPGDLAAILTNLEVGEVLFIDEIHRLNRVVEEFLYPAMEDFQLDLVVGQGPSARTIKLDLKRFTLVGATTRSGLLTSPLRDRFGSTFRLDFYQVAELAQIIRRSAKILHVEIDASGTEEIAQRSRGTPRIANRLPARHWRCSKLMRRGLIKWIARSCSRSSRNLTAGRSVSRRSLRRSAKRETRSRTCMNLI